MQPRTTHATYDEVPYEGGIASLTHPQLSAVIGRLFGMTPASVEACRVLEIGCGVGQNLVPIAYSLPGSSFVGIDLSGTHIVQARFAAEKNKLSNLTFEQIDIRSFQPTHDFDYIICHGVYSWVPPDAQAAILELCRRFLAPQGIAHISYNTLPGWHMRGAIREMMRSHARFFPDHGERVQQARALVEFLAEATGQFEGTSQLATAYHHIVRSELQMLQERADYYVMHEHLAEDNVPVYFLDFVEEVAKHGLQYLGDANFASMLSENLPDSIRTTLDDITIDHLGFEQYRDFVLNRMFRQSLVVRGEVSLVRDIELGVIPTLTARAVLRPSDGGAWEVPRAGGTASTVQSPLIVAVLEILASGHPQSLAFEDVRVRMPESAWGVSDAGARERLLASILLSLYATDAVELRTWDPKFAAALSSRPRVFQPALFMDNARGTPSPHHVTYGFDPLVAWLIPLLNGLVPREKLADLLLARINDGSLSVEGLPDGTSPGLEFAQSLVSHAFEQLRTTGMLES